MGYRVSGILKLPDGSPAANAEIEFISRKNYTPLLRDLKSNHRCTSSGAYDVTIEYGEYAVIVYPGGTYPAALGTIILSSDMQIGLDLPTLLQQDDWRPATPEYIAQINSWLARAESAATSSEAAKVSAKASEVSAKASESAALASKNGAGMSANTATTKAGEASASASAASASAASASESASVATAKSGEAEASASSALASKNSAMESASSASESASTASTKAAEASATEQRVLAATESQLGEISSLGDAQVSRVTSEGGAQTSRVVTEGSAQVARVALEGSSQIAAATAQAQASEASAVRSEAAAVRAEDLVEQATGGALLKDQNLEDVPNKEAARTHLDVPSKSQLAQAISEAIGAVTPASIGARPDSWIPTATDVGAVAKAGDTMTGNLTTPKVLVSEAQGTEINALTRKDYVNNELKKKLSLAGGTMTGSLTVPAVNLSDSQSSEPNTVTRKDYVDSAIAAAIGGVTPESIGARPDGWLPSLSEIGAAASEDLDPLIPAASASFVYTGSTLTQITEQLPSGERVTVYSYTDGLLTDVVETLGLLVRTTTYNYQAGILTGFTTTEGVA